MAALISVLQEQEDELRAQVANLDRQLSGLELTGEHEENAVRFAERGRQGLANLDFNQRQELMRLLVEDVTYHPGRAEVRTFVPIDG